MKLTSAVKERTQAFKVLDIEVDAYSEEHARRIATLIAGGTMDHVCNVTCIKKPRKATTCKTNDHPVKGTRKWETVYQVHAYGTTVPMGRAGVEYLSMEMVEDDIKQKTDAVKLAKAMAVKHQLPMTVQIAQKLTSHPTACADIEPATTKGKYLVSVVIIK